MGKSKFATEETTATTEASLDAVEPATEQSEAGKKISQAQLGVPKKRVQVEANGIVYSTLCDALVAHNLDKVKDWPAARNALKKEGIYTRMAPSEAVTEENQTPDEVEVTFKLADQDSAPVEQAEMIEQAA